MSSQDSVQKRVGQNAARNDLLILQTSLWLFLALGYTSVQYTYRARGETRKHAPNDRKYATSIRQIQFEIGEIPFDKSALVHCSESGV